MANVLLVPHPDPITGFPPAYARDSLPLIAAYPNGQSLPSPGAIDFTPGELLGSVSGELGLRRYLEDAGRTLVVTSDKEVPTASSNASCPMPTS
jgi:formate dehydrogenase